jgi:predicted HAD superfamily Cof-like phosphohydrolase
MCQLIELNREFYHATDQDYHVAPTALSVERRAQFMAYIIGEVVEYGNAPDIVSQIDALTDALYFIYDAFLEMGVDPDDFYKAVHDTNMKKAWPDGTIKWDETVIPPKLIKPPTWREPTSDIMRLIIRQRRLAYGPIDKE